MMIDIGVFEYVSGYPKMFVVEYETGGNARNTSCSYRYLLLELKRIKE